MYLHIGLVENEENKLQMLVDTNIAMNTDNKGYYQ